MYQWISALLHLGKSTTSESLGLNTFSHPWTYSYVFPPPALVHMIISQFLWEHVIGQFRLLILMAPCWIDAFWLPTGFSMSGDIPHQCLIIKTSYECFSSIGPHGSVVTALNCLAAQGCVLHRQEFSSSVCRAVAGVACVYKTGLPTMLKRMGWFGVLERVYLTISFLPLNLFISLGLDWLVM